MSTTRQIGARIRRIREKQGMSLTDLAKNSGVSRGYLHLIEKGENSPTQEKLAAIANTLGVLVAELIGEINEAQDLFDIPLGLQEFAEENDLPSADIVMLSKINYRGQRPQSAQEWKILYSVIKSTLEDKD
jgi:transcriptional regulator with XRE-family HTH domain